jgi:DNA-directed RNA polymerase specialized sigma24 family protein
MGTMNWERIEKWEYIAAHVADEYHKKYNMVEREDIKQSLYEWFVSHPRKLTEWEKLGNRSAQNLLYRSLRNQALDYCQLWKSKSIGYELSDLFYYEADVIEALLPAILRGDLAEAPKLNLGMPGRPSAPSEGGNLMAMMAEIKVAYDTLSKEDKSILFFKYANSLDYSSIATELQLSSDDAARMRHNRAIKKVINRLGGYRPFLDKDEVDDKGNDESNKEDTNNKVDDTEEQG